MVTRKAGRRSLFVKHFRLDLDNSIHVEYSDGSQPKKPGRHFASEERWAHIASEFPVSRLVAIWNGLPGIDPVRRFTSREIAASRILSVAAKNGASLAGAKGPVVRLRCGSDPMESGVH